MELIIITGTSGSGKSTALKSLEDFGYYCIDNFPPALYQTIPLLLQETDDENDMLAITVDIRSVNQFNHVEMMLKFLKDEGINYRVMFIDSDDLTLLKRFKETRRNHPLQSKDTPTIEEAIEKERKFMEFLSNSADFYIDTSYLKTSELKEEILNVLDNSKFGKLQVHFVSFGFKYGILRDADLVFDLRCLKNPYYDLRLRPLTGENKEVRDFVFESKEARGLFDSIENYLNYTLPLYKAEGKTQLIVGFGCTGGKHRSVSFAYDFMEKYNNDSISKIKRHRDIEKDKL